MVACHLQYLVLLLTPLAIAQSFAILEYDRPEQLYAYLENITSSHPNETSLINLGLTFEKRPIYCLKICKGEGSKGTIIAEFGAHAREWAGHVSATHVIHELLNNKKYENLLTKVTWYIVPLLNPDGFLFSKTEDRDWRKNRSPNLENEKCPGVDINRNFPVKWVKQHKICEEEYSGSRPSSENETMAIERLFTMIPEGKVDIYVSVHADAQCIVLPYAFTNDHPPNYRDLHEVAGKMKAAMERVGYPKYDIIEGWQMYTASGTVFDWVYNLKGVPLVFTLELPFVSEERRRFRVDRKEQMVIAKQCMAAIETKKMIVPVKIGIRADPPSLIFIYKMWGRLRMRTMPIRNLWPTTSTRFILEDIRARHDILLGVPDETIMKMIDVLKSLKGGAELEEALAKANHEQQDIGKGNRTHRDSQEIDHRENRISEGIDRKGGKSEETGDRIKGTDERKEKPYSFMDKKLADEDTDFDLNDDLPLDELDGNSDDDFWR